MSGQQTAFTRNNYFFFSWLESMIKGNFCYFSLSYANERIKENFCSMHVFPFTWNEKGHKINCRMSEPFNKNRKFTISIEIIAAAFAHLSQHVSQSNVDDDDDEPTFIIIFYYFIYNKI